METTICPIRQVDAESEALVQWFFRAARWDSFSGAPVGIREWPRPGGLMAQDARLVAAVDLLLAEVQYLPKARPTKERPLPEAGAESRSRARRGDEE